jgi:hypothetical protein
MKSPIQFFIAIAILLATATVAAQVYKWVDKDGQVQFTDTPPPPGATKAEAKKIDTGTSAPSASAPPAKTLQDRSKDFDKRQKAAAENAKKADESQKKEEIAESNCKAARTTLRELESGRAIRRINDAGEFVVMSDEVREAELAKTRAMVTESCKA